MNRSVAFELFGEMRHSTPEEQQLYRNMINKYKTTIEGINIFNMNENEYGTCDICGKEGVLNRKYYHYPIDCECCGGTTHFEIVRYCQNCTPVPPYRISVITTPIGDN